MAHLNISLATLQHIVEKATAELGNKQDGSVFITDGFDSNGPHWATKEAFYRGKLSYHSLELKSDTYYAHQSRYSELILPSYEKDK